MIANFNGIFYLVVFLLVMSINAFYAYNTLFNTKNFISKYGVDPRSNGSMVLYPREHGALQGTRG